MTRFLAFCNQKGGVGKSTCVINLAAAMAAVHGRRVLVVDLDPQQNASMTLLGDRYTDASATIWDVIGRDATSIEEALVESPHHERLFAIAGTADLAQWEKRLDAQRSDELLVAARTLLREVPQWIDCVLLDTPPSLGLWLQVGLAAADAAVVVAQAEEFSKIGIGQLSLTIQGVRNTVNPFLRVAGLLINHYRAGTTTHRAIVREYEEIFGADVLEPKLELRVVIPTSQSAYVPLEWFRHGGAAEPREWFRALAAELIRRVEIPASVGAADARGCAVQPPPTPAGASETQPATYPKSCTEQPAVEVARG